MTSSTDKQSNKQNKVFVTVYKGERRPDTYLYVPEASDLTDVPETLLELLGSLDKVLTVELHKDRKLAQADVHEVITQIKEEGYYLQLPPQNSQYVENELTKL